MNQPARVAAQNASILFVGSGLAPAASAMADAQNIALSSLPPHPTEAELIRAIEGERPSIIIVRSGKLTGNAIRAAKGLKLIAKHGVGVDSIDVEAATALGIPVSFAAGANAQSVAEHALALMFAVARNVPALDNEVKSGAWNKSVGIELTGKTLGLVGFGAISRRLAELVGPLRMPIVVYDPYLDPEALPMGTRVANSLLGLLAESDVVSLHCPLTTETRNMMGERQFAAMRARALLINTARGGLVDEAALAVALTAGRLGGAGLDTLACEPPEEANSLLSAANVVITPHIGADTFEARERVGMMVMRQSLDAIAGHLPAEWALANPVVCTTPAPTL